MRNIIALPSFERAARNLSQEEKGRLVITLRELNDFSATGNRSKGFGLKKIAQDKYEFRVDIRLRIALKAEGSDLYLVLVGNHDDIRRYLKAR